MDHLYVRCPLPDASTKSIGKVWLERVVIPSASFTDIGVHAHLAFFLFLFPAGTIGKSGISIHAGSNGRDERSTDFHHLLKIPFQKRIR